MTGYEGKLLFEAGRDCQIDTLIIATSTPIPLFAGLATVGTLLNVYIDHPENLAGIEKLRIENLTIRQSPYTNLIGLENIIKVTSLKTLTFYDPIFKWELEKIQKALPACKVVLRVGLREQPH